MFKKPYSASLAEVVCTASSSGRQLASGPNAPRDISFHIGLRINDTKPFVANINEGYFSVQCECQQADYLSAAEFYLVHASPQILVYELNKFYCEIKHPVYDFRGSVESVVKWLSAQERMKSLNNGIRASVGKVLLSEVANPLELLVRKVSMQTQTAPS